MDVRLGSCFTSFWTVKIVPLLSHLMVKNNWNTSVQAMLLPSAKEGRSIDHVWIDRNTVHAWFSFSLCRSIDTLFILIFFYLNLLIN
jgi:hypothetical protein